MAQFRTDSSTVVSLIPSATEILCALRLEKRITGISHECDFPAEIKDLPVLTEPKMDPKASSGQIDKDVRNLVEQGLSVYRIKTDVLERLQPDLIVTQDQCEVCAVSLKDVEEAVCGLTQKKSEICSLNPNCLEDIWNDIRSVGKATNSEKQAEVLISSLNHRIEPLKQLNLKKPRVACIEWLDPPMIAGGWIPELVKIAGGEPVIVSEPEKFKTVDWQMIKDAEPDFVVLMPCGFPVDQSLGELKENEKLSESLKEIPAVLQGRCYVVDGNAFFNRPGPRIVDSCEILAALIHPEKCAAFLSRYRSFIAQWPRS